MAIGIKQDVLKIFQKYEEFIKSNLKEENITEILFSKIKDTKEYKELCKNHTQKTANQWIGKLIKEENQLVNTGKLNAKLPIKSSTKH